MAMILWTLVISLALAFVLGFLLGVFRKVFHVETDETVAEIRGVLPGANCGGCGYPGCDGLAAAIAAGSAPVTACTAGGPAVAEAIGAILGVQAQAEKKAAVLLCRGSREKAPDKAFYTGVPSCRAAKISVNGTKQCDSGCIGFGDCASACPFGAVQMSADGLPVVDLETCTGCGVCVSACPQHLLALFPVSGTGALLRCSCCNPVKNRLLKDCKAACIKCGKCARQCHANAITMDPDSGLPAVDRSLCDSCGECVHGCPTGALCLAETVFSPAKEAESLGSA